MSLISIGELADRTGVQTSTLRSWEQRLGFPEPVRSAGGQRRYRAEDAELVTKVVAGRDRGLSLAAAVDAVLRQPRVGAQSLFAQLRETHPHLEVLSLSMQVMRSLTWSIEDECLAYASHPLLFGCFQDQRSFDVAGRRWRELSRSALGAYAFADFIETDVDAKPTRVELPEDSPMLNEWSLVCQDAQLSVALVAWEPPRSAGDGTRRFEALLTLEPDVVHHAARLCAATAESSGIPGVLQLVDEQGADTSEDPRRTASLLRRFARYSDR